MRTHGRILCAGLSLAIAAGASLLAPRIAMAVSSPKDGGLNAPTPAAQLAEQCIDQLASTDYAKRENAAAKLISLGVEARPAVLAAMDHDPSPEVRARCAAILMQWPWNADADPPAIKRILLRYGGGFEHRAQLIQKLIDQGIGVSFDALLRLLCEEPSNDLRWTIAAALRDTSAAQQERLRAIDTQQMSRPPVLAAVGLAWAKLDPPRAAALIRKALEIDAADPSNDLGQFDAAVDVLYDYELSAARPEQAAQVLRLQHLRGADTTQRVPPQVLKLFVLHSDMGPLAGFEQDLKIYAPWLGQPPIMYALGRMYARSGRQMLADSYYAAACAAGGAVPENHLETGQFLMESGWSDLAELEFRAALDAGSKKWPAIGCSVHYAMARLAALREDDATAAAQLRAALGIAKNIPELSSRVQDELTEQIDWREMRIAKARRDDRAVDDLLNKLSSRLPTHPDAAIDVIVFLKERGRADDAKHAFEELYNRFKTMLRQTTNDAESMNNLAWVCARCGERMAEAAQLADGAMRLAPANAAYIDTAAEVYFRMGRREDAVNLETRAIQLRPNDRFMKAQLKRFAQTNP